MDEFRDTLLHHFDSSTVHHIINAIASHQSRTTKEETDVFVMVFVFTVFVVAFVVIWWKLMYTVKIGTLLRKFPYLVPYTGKQVFDVYLMLCFHMIRLERQDLAPQFRFFKGYMDRKFRGIGDHSRAHYNYVMNLEVNPDDAVVWVAKKMSHAQHLQLIDLLTDLAFYNDIATSREIQFINRVGRQLGISASDITSILAIRHARIARKQEQAKKMAGPRTHNLQQAFSILGLPHNSSWEEVRKSYRRLAKEFHPDLFARGSAEEQAMAHERFTEIKLAYELLQAHIG
jgi:DnaJ-domain-containing protein 1